MRRQQNRRGLVLYKPGQSPQWIGARVTSGSIPMPGPGAIKSWPAYDGKKLIGLDPTQSYVFDDAVRIPPDYFHITKVPRRTS